MALPAVTLQVTEWPGEGDPVLLLHATGFHSRCWGGIARELPGVHIYAVDARFHGGSDRHGEVNWLQMAGDAARLPSGPHQQARILSAPISAIITVGAWMLLPVMFGMTDESITRRRSTPCTLRPASTTAVASVPIGQVPAV